MRARSLYFQCLLALVAVLITACNAVIAPTRPSDSVPQNIAALVRGGAQLTEVPPPALDIPPDIYSAQMTKYFRINDSYFALVLQPSVNVPLEMDELRTSFVGVLYAPAQVGAWRKLFVLAPAVPADKNNPYWMWTNNKELYISVVDQNGAGSGEGIMKVLKLDALGNWDLNSCYYFGGAYNGPETDGDYFAFSSRLDRQQALPLDQCSSWGNLIFARA